MMMIIRRIGPQILPTIIATVVPAVSPSVLLTLPVTTKYGVLTKQ